MDTHGLSKRARAALVASILCVFANAQFAGEYTGGGYEGKTSSASSFEPVKDCFHFGIRAGIGSSWVRCKQDGKGKVTNWSSPIAHNISVNLDVPLNTFLGVNLEAGYFGKGGSVKYKKDEKSDYPPYIEGIMDYTASYLQINVLPSFRCRNKKGSGFEFVWGPYLAYGLSGTGEGKIRYGTSYGRDPATINLDSWDIFDQFNEVCPLKRLDAGMIIGYGGTMRKFYLAMRHEIGLKNLLKNEWIINHSTVSNSNVSTKYASNYPKELRNGGFFGGCRVIMGWNF